MASVLLLGFLIAVSFAEIPDNNTFIEIVSPQQKEKPKEGNLEKKSCVSYLDPIECDVLEQINRIRSAKSLPVLQSSQTCSQMAHAHTKYMVGLSNSGAPLSRALNHDGFSERIKKFGLNKGKASENVAAGTRLLQDEVVSMWMKSPGHRQNILDADVRYTGIAAIRDGKGNVFWTQCFSSRP